MTHYEELRRTYRPDHIKYLFIAESPPPGAEAGGSRHFYRSDTVRRGDRLFVNTIQALYPEAADKPEADLEAHKEAWLRRFQANGCYLTEALEVSQRHEVTKEERQQKIREALPRLIERVGELAEDETELILIKSNVFEVAAEPLRAAGFRVLNQYLLDYPGRFNQRAYRTKLAEMMQGAGWSGGGAA
jgi:hypothetical protein